MYIFSFCCILPKLFLTPFGLKHSKYHLNIPNLSDKALAKPARFESARNRSAREVRTSSGIKSEISPRFLACSSRSLA